MISGNKTINAKFERLCDLGWVFQSLNYASAVISDEFEREFDLLLDSLLSARFTIEDAIIKRGGGRSDQTTALGRQFVANGWKANNITIKNRVEFSSAFSPIDTQSTTHEIDHLISNENNKLAAIEIEWNNKDEFFDRDVQAIRRLYEMNVVDLGGIVTRSPKLEEKIPEFVLEYFINWPIKCANDFANVASYFEQKYGRNKFSFPTDVQAAEIDRKVKAGTPYVDAASRVFVASKYAGTTTNWRQLQSRVQRKDLGRAPTILIGIPPSAFS
ncbi:hypothetical protein DDZ18_09260 [Marinicauda salina]|uniref:Restriction endonuclease n=1 Tax=Marinicauda salina TaxID=2135793 RepID=A0A2U2BSA4_9PROT|nr:BglII/BstYI family type II restriction endonuclease [Marinicauda salina]PWE16893.1 hypothetical protein DDZ18_09260 [Marinicauda salina]